MISNFLKMNFQYQRSLSLILKIDRKSLYYQYMISIKMSLQNWLRSSIKYSQTSIYLSIRSNKIYYYTRTISWLYDRTDILHFDEIYLIRWVIFRQSHCSPERRFNYIEDDDKLISSRNSSACNAFPNISWWRIWQLFLDAMDYRTQLG